MSAGRKTGLIVWSSAPSVGWHRYVISLCRTLYADATVRGSKWTAAADNSLKVSIPLDLAHCRTSCYWSPYLNWYTPPEIPTDYTNTHASRIMNPLIHLYADVDVPGDVWDAYTTPDTSSLDDWIEVNEHINRTLGLPF